MGVVGRQNWSEKLKNWRGGEGNQVSGNLKHLCRIFVFNSHVLLHDGAGEGEEESHQGELRVADLRGDHQALVLTNIDR